MKELKSWEKELGLESLKDLSELGIIEFDTWKEKMNEEVPLWLLLTLLNRIYKKLK